MQIFMSIDLCSQLYQLSEVRHSKAGFLSETISHDDNFQYMVANFTSLLPPMKLW